MSCTRTTLGAMRGSRLMGLCVAVALGAWWGGWKPAHPITQVYNVSGYLAFHPGGPDELMRGAGEDASALVAEVHPWVRFGDVLRRRAVGKLVPSAAGTEIAWAENPARPAALRAAAAAPSDRRPAGPAGLEPDAWCPVALVDRRQAAADAVWLRFLVPGTAHMVSRGSALA